MIQNQPKKNKKRTKWHIVLPSFIFIYLFFRSTPSLFAARFKTILPESNLIEDRIAAESIIIRKEYLYEAGGAGELEIISEEGQKVAAGTKIARLTLLKNTSTLNKDLKEINRKIDVLTDVESNSNIVKNDVEKIADGIKNTMKEIQSSVYMEDYGRVALLRDKLSVYEKYDRNGSGGDKLLSQSLEGLEDKRDEVIEQISSNIKEYISQEPGIVSFKIDGYENLYSSSHRDVCDFSHFENIDQEYKIITDKDDVDVGEPIFKIIDNFEWYMIINIEKFDDIGPYEEGDDILIGGDETESNLRGRIEKITKEKGKGLILCKFNTDFQNYYDKRFMKIDIIKNSKEGYKIPTKSIIEKDGIKGVYIKGISGIIQFKPIKILLEKDKTTYIETGDENNNIQIEEYKQPFKTINSFDEILLNTVGIKEGMVIN